MITATALRARCGTRLAKGYRSRNEYRTKARFYIGRNVGVSITDEEIKLLWERDNARDLQRPTFIRIDLDKDFSYTNCMFISGEAFRRRQSLVTYERRAKDKSKTQVNIAKPEILLPFFKTLYQAANYVRLYEEVTKT